MLMFKQTICTHYAYVFVSDYSLSDILVCWHDHRNSSFKTYVRSFIVYQRTCYECLQTIVKRSYCARTFLLCILKRWNVCAYRCVRTTMANGHDFGNMFLCFVTFIRDQQARDLGSKKRSRIWEKMQNILREIIRAYIIRTRILYFM